MNLKGLICTFSWLSLLSLTFSVFANTPHQLIGDNKLKNIDDLPNEPEQMMTWTCNNQDNRIVVEAKDDKLWLSIIEQQNWSCQESLSNIPKGALQFTCEPIQDGLISILTVTWLTGKDENKQMGQWLHQFADEYNMSCSMVKVGLLDDV